MPRAAKHLGREMDFSEVEEILRGVTPGPWTLCRLADHTPHSIQASYGCVNGLSALFTLAHINAPDEAEVGMTDGAFDRETADANARFIAWCREGVPALLAQIAALRAERDDALTFLDNAVSKAPEPLKALGKYLAGRLDEDEWPTAEQYLNAAAKACANRATAALTTEADNG